MDTDQEKIDITREHPEYRVKQHMWRRYRDLYTGGEQFKENATHYLVSRQREVPQVYYERLSRVFYENYVGSIIDWYTATLFRREPVITLEGSEPARRFFSELIEDCDLRGTALTDFFRNEFIEALVCGKGHILVDFPRVGGTPETRADEDAMGASRAYLVGYSAEDLINWSYDEHGNYEWVVLRTHDLRKQRVEDREWVKQTRWAYYDKQRYRIFDSTQAEGRESTPAVIAEGFHGLAKQNTVPLFDVRVGEGLWLMNRAALLQLEHFNKSNALSWALNMGLFAMPVVYSEREWNQVVGESYYLQLGPEDRFGWTEPEGHVFQVAADNLTRLQQEIYRVCYMTQAGGELSGSGAQSALSKQRDFSITQEVLRAYGDAVKDALKRVLRAIIAAREDVLRLDVSGVDEFDIGDFSIELDEAERLLNMGIQSPTLRKQVFKKLALKYLCDSQQDIKDRIAGEIEEAS
ncbi:MAG TPA: hypothetical protein VKU01_16240 [Bryobacteraceae bacterium]|nr:hypothetical protein [Bryobacteraceae bacterium]